MPLFPSVITPPAHKNAWMLLPINSALESVRNLRVTELAVEDVQKSAGMLSNRRELWRNAENMAWTKQNMEINAFMRSVQRSAWMPLNLVTVCLSVKDMKAILDVAQVNVLWIVKRNHYGESVLQSVSHLKEILIAVPLLVLPNVQIDEGRSAVQEVSQSVITFLVVVQNILMLSMELEFIFHKAVNQERFN